MLQLLYLYLFNSSCIATASAFTLSADEDARERRLDAHEGPEVHLLALALVDLRDLVADRRLQLPQLPDRAQVPWLCKATLSDVETAFQSMLRNFMSFQTVTR